MGVALCTPQQFRCFIMALLVLFACVLSAVQASNYGYGYGHDGYGGGYGGYGGYGGSYGGYGGYYGYAPYYGYGNYGYGYGNYGHGYGNYGYGRYKRSADHEQVHVSGSTGPTVVGSGHHYPAPHGYAPVYAHSYPYYAGYATHSYPYSYPARYGYSAYAPAVSTHGYGNVNHATATPFVYTRDPADPHYGQQDRQGYSSYGQNVISHYPYYSYPARSAYSGYVPAASTHSYGNVPHA